MAQTSSRLTSTGNLLLNGQFDEVTFNSTAGNSAIINQFSRSQDFTNSYWAKNSTITVANTAAVTAPDGTSTAQIATVGGTGLYPYIAVNPRGNTVPATPGTVYTVSAYAKYINQANMTIVNEDGWTGGMSASFNIQTGVVGSKGANVTASSMTDAGNGWYRMSATYAAFPSGLSNAWNPQPIRVGLYNATNYSNSQVYIWGAQLEASSGATIYQPIAAANTLVAGSITKQTANTIYTSGTFDEVTLSGSTTAQRIDSTGTWYVSNNFDEFTGASIVDGNVVLWLDTAQTASYSGSGSTWTDLSTNALNGTLVGSPTFSTSPANILFNGSSQRVSFSSNTAVQFLTKSSYTLQAWIYPTAIPATNSYQGIIDRESGSSPRDGWTFWLNGNAQASTTTMQFGAERFGSGTSTGAYINVTAASTLNVWQQVAVTYDGTTIKVYRNGAQIGTATSSVNITNSTSTLTLASRGTTEFLNGSISQVMVYNRAFSADEVQQNFNALRNRYGL